MQATPAGLSEADWLATHAKVRDLVTGQQEKILQLQNQQTALATELAGLRERLGRNSRNSSSLPSSDGQGLKSAESRKGSGRKRGGQQGHAGAGPELLPFERFDEVVDHRPYACRRCGTLLQGDDTEPLRHKVIEIPPITAQVTCHRLHRLNCPCCSIRTRAELPADMEQGQYRPRLSALVGLLGSAFPLSISKTQALLDQLLGVSISGGAPSPPSAPAWPRGYSSRWRKPCSLHASSRWSTWMKPVHPPAMRMEEIPMAVAAGYGC